MPLKNTKVKNKKSKYNKVIINWPIIIACYAIIAVFIISLFFSSSLELIFKLKPDLSQINSGSLEVHFVDVGQGDAILIKLPNNKNVIIDSGPSDAKDNLFNYIDNVFFRNNNNKTFHYAILTHSDYDHSGNMLDILNKYSVEAFYRPMIYAAVAEREIIQNDSALVTSNKITYENLVSKLIQLKANNKISVDFAFAGISIGDDNVNYITFLSPNKEIYSGENLTNKFSPILLLEYNNKKFLLTGDSVNENEVEVISNTNTFEIDLDVDVLKVAHHGSNTSTSENFLSVIRPEFAVISHGLNSYGHPNAEVVNKLISNLQINGADERNLYTTYNNGNIIFHVNAAGELRVLTLQRVSDYLFIHWYVVVIVVGVIFVMISIYKGIHIRKTRASNV